MEQSVTRQQYRKGTREQQTGTSPISADLERVVWRRCDQERLGGQRRHARHATAVCLPHLTEQFPLLQIPQSHVTWQTQQQLQHQGVT